MQRDTAKKPVQRSAAMLLCVLLALAGLIAPASAANGRTVRVGYYITPGFQEYDEATGAYNGYGYEYLMALAQWAGWQYEFVPVSFAEGVQLLEKGELDLMNNVSITAERQETLAFSQLASGENQAYLVGGADSRVAYEDYKAISRLKVGLVSTSIYSQKFLDWCVANGCTPACRWFDTKEEAIAAMEAGEIDARIITSSQKLELHIIASFAPEPFYFAVPKGETALLQELDRAMNSIKTGDPEFETRLKSKYYGNAAQTNTVLSDEEQAYVAEHRQVTLLYDPDFYPLSGTGTDGKLAGAAADIFARLTAETGLAFAPEPCTAEELTKRISPGEEDLVLGLIPYDYSWAQQHGVRLMQPVLDVTVSWLRREDAEQAAGTVAVVEGTYLAGLVREQYGDQLTYAAYPDVEACLEAVRTGRAESTCLTTYECEYYSSRAQYRSLIVSVAPRLSYSLSAGVSVGADSRLYTLLQKGFNAISSDDMDGILQALMRQVQSPDALSVLLDHPEILIPVALLMVLLLAGMASLAIYLTLAHRRNRVITRKNSELAEALASADSANSTRSDLLAKLSHELRTPMNAIVGLSKLAGAHADEPDRVKGYMEKIGASSAVLLHLLSDMLDLSAIEGKRLNVASKPFDMQAVLCGLEETYAGLCRRRGIEYAVQADALPEKLVGDPERLSQVLDNLLSNACKFTQAGGRVTLTCREQTRQAGQVFLRFTVQDNGCGMSEEMLQRVFQPFQQEDSSAGKTRGSTGLGLSITQNLVRMMHGAISVKSRKGEGTTFTVDMPFGLAAQETAPSASVAGAPAAASPAQGLPQVLCGKRVLLAEDNDINAEIAAELLRMAGMTVDRACNGKEAVEQFEKSASGTYDVVLMDVQMPEMDGHEATRRIRACSHPEGATVPIYAMTANAFPKDVSEALQCGMNGHIAKPIDTAVLFETLRQALEKDH